MQGGAGTSINMNVNEVIASRAQELASGHTSHANDHVNRSQSTNDVNPSALKLTCLRLTAVLLDNLETLAANFNHKADQFKDVHKLGRTHMQDALPTTLGAEFRSYAAVLKRDGKRIHDVYPYLLELNLGGTAIGNSINASDEYIRGVYEELEKLTGQPVRRADNLMSLTSSPSDFCHLSSAINILFTDIAKIATDIRVLASGPQGGIGEIVIKELQAGSSIMPGKVNPIIPEAMSQIAFDISGKNLTIHQAAQNSSLELAIMFPVLADSLISMLQMSSSGLSVFGSHCIKHITANPITCTSLLEESTAYATLLVPKLGYDVTSSVVKEAVSSKQSIRVVVLQRELLTEFEFEDLVSSPFGEHADKVALVTKRAA